MRLAGGTRQPTTSLLENTAVLGGVVGWTPRKDPGELGKDASSKRENKTRYHVLGQDG